jgi:surface-anchored protein
MSRRTPLRAEPLEDRLAPATLDTFLTTGHTDLTAVFGGGTWNFQPREAAGPVSHDPDRALLVVGTNAQEARPAGAAFDFVGVAAGANYYHLPAAQNPDLLYLGVAGYGVPAGAFTAYDAQAESKGRVGSFPVEWTRVRLTAVNGPGTFSMWQDDVGGPIVAVSSFNDGVSNPNGNGLDATDGISADDVAYVIPGGHSHYNFGFTAAGRYEVTFRLSGRQGATVVESDPITLYFSVGNVGRFVVNPSTYTVNENAGTASVTVTRVGGADGRITVNYATAGGTATSGTDFTATTGTLTFNDGETTKNILVPITDDTAEEGDENFTLTLSNPGPASIATYTVGIPGGSLLGATTTATVTISANDPNVAPTISDSPNQTLSEDTPLVVNFTVGDTQTPPANLNVMVSGGNALIASLVLGGSGANRTLTVTPAANAFGAGGTVTLSVSDGTFTTNDTFDVTITPVADAPSVTPATTNEDTQSAGGLVVTRNAADGAEVTHFRITGITNGTLFQNNGTTPITDGAFITFAQGNAGLRFTPAANLNGSTPATFGFSVQASTSNVPAGLGGAVVPVGVTVNPVNDPPNATTPASVTVGEDSGAFSQANFLTGFTPGGGADESGQTLVIVSAAVGNGALFSVQPAITPDGTLSFTPAAGVFGTTTVTPTILDSGGTANGGVNTRVLPAFTITITAAADTPSVTNATTNEGVQSNGGLVISRNAADGAEVTHFQITGITNGSLFQNDGTTPITNGAFITFAQGNAGLRFTPAAGIGDGSFAVQASTSNAAGGLGGGTATATITVIRNTPFAADDEYGVGAARILRGNVLLNDADPNGDPITVTANTAPAHGTLVINPDGTFTYTPGPTFAGTDTFAYTIADTTPLSATATVTITGRPADPGIGVAYSVGDVDIGIAFEGGEWEPHVHDEDGGLEFEPGGAIFHVRPDALLPRPADPAFDFIGVAAGANFYRLPANPNPALLFLGFGGEELVPGEFVNDEVTFRVLAVDGPGHLSIWDDTPGGPVVLASTADGLTGSDARVVLAGSHSHSNWGFTARGLYAVTVRFSGTLTAGGFTEAVTYYFAVDPANAAPVNTAPATATTARDTAVSLTGVSVADSDPHANPARVTLTATNGTVAAPPAAGVTVVSNTGAELVLEGATAALNAALAGLTFTPTAGFAGAATVAVRTSDGGFLVGETALTDEDVIAVTVVPPEVSVEVVANAAEPGTNGVLRFTRTGPTGASLTVNYTVGGTATAGTDYAALSGTVTFAAGQSAVDVPVTPIDDAAVEGTEAVVVTLTPAAGVTVTGPAATVTLADDDNDTPAPTPDKIAVGAGSGGGAKLVDATGAGFAVEPFPGVAGGVRVATADVTGDGVPDLIVASGPGGPPAVKVFDGATRAEVASFLPFEASFVGGLYVAAADLDGDGKAEFVVSPDEGGGPRVTVFSLASGSPTVLANFFGIDDASFRGGARVALGDINGDGTPDLMVAAGFQGGPRVAVFDGTSVGPGRTPTKLFNDFFVFEEALRNGAFVAFGDVDGDGRADLIAGGGPGGAPRVRVLDGAELLAGREVQVGNFFAGDSANRSGVRVAAADTDADGRAEVLTGAAAGSARVSRYRIDPTAATLAGEFDAFDTPGGVFVG